MLRFGANEVYDVGATGSLTFICAFIANTPGKAFLELTRRCGGIRTQTKIETLYRDAVVYARLEDSFNQCGFVDADSAVVRAFGREGDMAFKVCERRRDFASLAVFIVTVVGQNGLGVRLRRCWTIANGTGARPAWSEGDRGRAEVGGRTAIVDAAVPVHSCPVSRVEASVTLNPGAGAFVDVFVQERWECALTCSPAIAGYLIPEYVAQNVKTEPGVALVSSAAERSLIIASYRSSSELSVVRS
eukprot:IDg12675t1